MHNQWYDISCATLYFGAVLHTDYVVIFHVWYSV